MNTSKLKIATVVVTSIFLSLYLGVTVATEQVTSALWVVGTGTLVGLFALGRHVWAVIPVAAAFSGGLVLLPGFPQPWYVATPLVAGFMVARLLMRSRMFQFRWTWLDTFMAIQVVALVQAYIRNPSGLAIFGNEMVGGRQYYDYAVAITGYFLLSFVRTDMVIFKRVAICVIVVSILDDLTRAATNLSGGLARLVGTVYSNVESQAYEAGGSYAFDLDTRFGGFKEIGLTLCLLCFAFRRPLACFLPGKLWPFLCIIASGVFIFMSGFRSSLVRAGCYFIAGSLIRRKPWDIAAVGVAGSMFLFFFGAAAGFTRLPMPVQRALSFLPFEVSPEIRAGAQASADWRFEMWKIVLSSDRYIKNKWLGDGFGYSKAELLAQADFLEGRGYYGGDSIDMFIAKGSYHGWHVEAIRFTGVFGLGVGVCLLFGFAVYASRAIKHYRQTKYFGYVSFICIPFLIEPFFHIFVFGSYKGSFILLISAAGILRLLDNIRVRERAELARVSTPERQVAPGRRASTPALPVRGSV